MTTLELSKTRSKPPRIDIKPCLFCCEPCPACFDFCDSCIEETTHYERIAMVREALSL